MEMEQFLRVATEDVRTYPPGGKKVTFGRNFIFLTTIDPKTTWPKRFARRAWQAAVVEPMDRLIRSSMALGPKAWTQPVATRELGRNRYRNCRLQRKEYRR